MRVAVLGIVAAETDDGPVDLGPPMARAVLAVLAVNGGRTATYEQLSAALWGPRPPASARASLHNQVLRLRRVLGDAAVRRTPDGYRLDTAVCRTDLLEFEDLAAAGDAALRERRWKAAADTLAAALALWRDEPLSDLASRIRDSIDLQPARELRSVVREQLADAEVNLGRPERAAADLRSLTVEAPLRESAHAGLMRALYCAGRQAEALSVYQDLRRLVVAELGIEPSAAVAALHQRILAADPALLPAREAEPDGGGSGGARGSGDGGGIAAAANGTAAAAAPNGTPVAGGPATRPRLLPAPDSGFVGRHAELAALDRVLDGRPGRARTVLLVGPAGVGKTSLAVHWAHAAADRFPDGQLYADLHGYDGTERASPHRVLERFLLALGVPAQAIPLGAEAREDLYRSTLHSRRLLVVLDNAGDTDQIRPLLPGATTTMTVVTSRDRLGALIADTGATGLELGMLPPHDAVAALARIAGDERVAADPDAAADLARLCGGLPLALRISAVRLVQDPATSVGRLAADLVPEDTRLDGLRLPDGDGGRAVTRSLDHSYRRLGPEAARCLRLIASFPGFELSGQAVAAMAAYEGEGEPAPVADALHTLTAAHLAGRTGDRYALHDLVRLYGRALPATSAGEQDEFRDRALGWYLASAEAATSRLSPLIQLPEMRVRRPWTGPVDAVDRDTALAWFAAEQDNIEALTQQALARGDHTAVWQLATVRIHHLLQRHHLGRLIESTEAGERAALADGQDVPAAILADMLGVAFSILHDLRAFPAYGRALAAAERAGDNQQKCRIIAHRGSLHYELHEYEEAIRHYDRSLILMQELNDRFGIAQTRANLGLCLVGTGRAEAACDHFAEAVVLIESLGDEARAVSFRGQHAFGLLRAGRPKQALDLTRRCLADAERFDDPLQVARMTDQAGLALDALGEQAEARATWQRSLAMFEQIGSDHATEVRERLNRK